VFRVDRDDEPCVVKWRLTMVENDVAFSNSSRGNMYNSYLPGRGDTMIMKVVHPGRGSDIALRLC